ncbi:MAG: phosphoserine phosphatase SerB, partial [Pseudomonadota bacterium]|nr:phosphoserine phosphatase SerB [Pseudomonadota bacterium]
NEKKISVSNSKNLSDLVLDIYFTCTLEDFDFTKKKIYSLNKKADLLMQMVKHRKKKLIACDMDMTIINLETINLINDNLLKNNQIAKITKEAMSGNINFKNSIITRTKLLKGIKKVEIVNLIKKIKINKGVKSVIRTMNNYGYHTMLISGGYDLIANSIGKKAGFKEIRCNTLEIVNNQLTGNLKNTILDKKEKLFCLKSTIKKLNIKKDLTLAVGDGDNDIDMIKYSGLGVAWNAYEKVRFAADVSISFNFKSLLYFQGYTEKEISC